MDVRFNMFSIGKNKIDVVFVLGILSLTIILWSLPTGFENPRTGYVSLRTKAKVISVNNDDLETFNVVTVGTQELELEILSGQYKHTVVKGYNVLMGQKRIDKIFKKDDDVLTIIRLDNTKTKVIDARAIDIYRIHIELILFFFFALFLLSFARWTGFKALLSFVFTAVCIWKILLPLFLKGFSPVPLSFLMVSFLTTVIVLLISGFTKKGLVALSGSIAGIGITTCLALLFGHYFQIPGTTMEFSETLIYAGFFHLRISDIFISTIFISAAGAVMDVAMDIAAAQNELIEKKPDMGLSEMIRSGFQVAYPVIGTMTTTLLFAYSGSFMFVFMAFMVKGTPMVNIFNINYIAAELLHTLVGSFGLVLVAPATAIIGGYVYTKKLYYRGEKLIDLLSEK